MRREPARIVVGAAAVLALLAGPAAAQAPGGALTVRQAVEIALERSPLLRAAGHELAAAGAGIDRARAGFLPRLDVGEAFSAGDSPVFAFSSKLNQGRFTSQDFDVDRLNDPGATTNFRTSITLTQPLFTGGRASIGLDRARLARDAAARGVDRQRQEVAFATARAYYGLLLAREDLEVARSAGRAAEANRDLARARHATGLAVEAEALSAEVRLASLRERVIAAESRLTLAAAGLNDVMGRALDEPLEPVDALSGPGHLSDELAELEQDALERRPDYHRLRAEERGQERAVAQARAEFLPTVDATGSYEVNRHDVASGGQDSWFVGLALRWNLFNGLADRARLAEARAGLDRLRALRDRLASAIRLEVRDAYLARRSAEERVGVAQGAVAQAEESLRVVRDRYGAGLTTIVDLLQTEAALTQAQGNLSRARHDTAVARAAIALATGTIGPETFR